jgi:outer membrane protein assembly factor BamB
MEKGSPNVADPVLFDDKVFISSSEMDSRGAVLDISGEEPRLVWETPEMANHVSTCIYLDGYLYGATGNYLTDVKKCTLRCLDAENGQLMWEEKTGGAALTAADGKLIVLTFKGTLYIAQASSTAFKVISSCEVPSRSKAAAWWTPPVLCGNKIYCRSHIGDLVCIDVSE